MSSPPAPAQKRRITFPGQQSFKKPKTHGGTPAAPRKNSLSQHPLRQTSFPPQPAPAPAAAPAVDDDDDEDAGRDDYGTETVLADGGSGGFAEDDEEKKKMACAPPAPPRRRAARAR